MEQKLLYVILSTLFLLMAIIRLFMRNKCKNLPPSPPAIPILGHLHLLKQPLHRTLRNLSQKYGPIITLRIANRPTIVVTSPSAVEECLTKNDVIFANRPSYSMSKYTDYNSTTLGTTNFGDHWRNLRRICTFEIFSSQRLNEFKGIRKDEVYLLLRRLRGISSHGFAKVGLKPIFFDLANNVVMRMVAGKRYCGEDNQGTEEAQQFKQILQEYLESTEMTNLGDLFPILQWFDYGGLRKKFIRLGRKIDCFLQGLIDEHRIDKDRNTMINRLLASQESQPDYYSDETIKGLILSLVIAGGESTSVVLEWAMANLLNNPSVLEKAKAELDSKIGEDRLIDESDLPKLSYLQGIIYESSRLSPVVPLLPPHLSSADCTVGGYHVPANTMLFINTWAIQRDPNLWEDPTSFKPERFENGKVNEGFKFLPFGLGRRACPGEKLANREIGMTLGSMIQCFEWKKIGDKEIDMGEKTKILMSKVKPLEVMCRARPILRKVLTQAAKESVEMK